MWWREDRSERIVDVLKRKHAKATVLRPESTLERAIRPRSPDDGRDAPNFQRKRESIIQ